MEIGTYIVKIDSRTRSFCLCQYVQNGLSYSGKETRPKLCLKGRQADSGIRSLGTNKHQLLHRIQSVRSFTNLQYLQPQVFLYLRMPLVVTMPWLQIKSVTEMSQRRKGCHTSNSFQHQLLFRISLTLSFVWAKLFDSVSYQDEKKHLILFQLKCTPTQIFLDKTWCKHWGPGILIVVVVE